MFANVFILLLMILNEGKKIENLTKIRGWDVFSIVFNKIGEFQPECVYKQVRFEQRCVQ